MKMKKILAAILLASCLLTLAACGSSGAGTVPPAGQTGGNNGGNNGGDNTNDFPKFKTANTKEVVLTAENGCVVTLTPMTYREDYAELRVNFQNNTDGVRKLNMDCFSINGMMLDNYVFVEAEAGEADVDVIEFYTDELRMMGIFQIAKIEILFNIMDEDWNVEETLTCKIDSTAADKYEADPMAYFNAVTSEKAQKQLYYKVKDSVDTRTALGHEVYAESIVYVEKEYSGEQLRLELVNESSQMRYVQIGVDMVNGMTASGGDKSYTIFPGARAVVTIDMEWVLESSLREAFGMKGVSTVELSSEVYTCYDDGSMNWEEESEYEILSYTVPGTSEKPDYSGMVLYEENGLKITAKAPVEEVYSDEYKETYVYLIFENVGDMDLYIRENYDKEIIVETGEDGYVYFQNPSYLYMGERVVCYVEVDNMTGNSIFLPLTAEDNDDISNCWEVDLNIQF